MNLSRLIKNCTPLASRWILASGSRCQSTSASSLVQVDVNDQNGIAVVSLCRKPVNALSLELFKEFCGVMDDLEKANIRGMILKSVMRMHKRYLKYELITILSSSLIVTGECFLQWP